MKQITKISLMLFTFIFASSLIFAQSNNYSGYTQDELDALKTELMQTAEKSDHVKVFTVNSTDDPWDLQFSVPVGVGEG
ncbi:MAG: hypothetical protein ACLFPE_07355, partial [Bacteroidales bacterium]